MTNIEKYNKLLLKYSEYIYIRKATKNEVKRLRDAYDAIKLYDTTSSLFDETKVYEAHVPVKNLVPEDMPINSTFKMDNDFIDYGLVAYGKYPSGCDESSNIPFWRYAGLEMMPVEIDNVMYLVAVIAKSVKELK